MRHTDSEALLELLSEIYGPTTADRYHPKLLKLLNQAPESPVKSRRPKHNGTVLIAYPDHVRSSGQTPLASLNHFCRQHLKDLVDSVHILPFYPSTSDDGFAVRDFETVDEKFGSWQDIEQLGQDFGLMFDGVFNHVSASHPWFQGFLADKPGYREYFIALDKTTDVSMVTRPRTSPLLVAFDTAAGQKYVWATFSADQLDLNYANPEVLLEIISIILTYVSHGASLIRLDAIGYLWKQPGTPSIHLPRTHAIIRLIRTVLDAKAPLVKLVTETNVPHNENITYFGDGYDEAQLVYNFALPPLLVHALQTGNASVLSSWAATLTTPSDQTNFFNFTASHDGIGLLGARKFLSAEQIDAMCLRTQQRGGHLSMRTLASGQQSVYEMNTTYFDAVTDPANPSHLAVDQFMCSQAIALSLAGVAGIYLPSLFGSRNWMEGVRDQGHNRAINRQKFDLDKLENQLSDSGSTAHEIFSRYTHLLKIRGREAAFMPQARQIVHQNYGPAVFAVERQADNGDIVLALHNVTSRSVAMPLSKPMQDLISGLTCQRETELGAYQTAWLK